MANAALAQLVTWANARAPAAPPNVKNSAQDAARRRARALAQLRHHDTFDTGLAAELLDVSASATMDTLRAWQKAGIVEEVTPGTGGRRGTWRVVR